MRGQAEVVIVLGIIVIAAVAVVFTTQREVIFPPSSEVAALRDSLESEIEQNLYSKALEILEAVGRGGGYMEPPKELSVSYQGSDAPYWHYAGHSLVPEKDMIESNIANALGIYANSMGIKEYQGKDVSMGSASPDVTIAPDSVNVKLWMPVTLEGYSLSQPFEFSVPSGLGKAYDTASQIADRNLEGRYLDYFTVASIFMYGALDGYGNPKVPSFGVLTQCGQVLHKNWFEVKDEVETLMKGFLARTYMAGQTPKNVVEESNFPVHVFPLKTDIPVTFRLGESLDSRSFQFNPNPVRAQAEVVPMAAICMSPPYLVHYWLMYPVIAEVKEGGYALRFALQVYVDDNKPGNWSHAGIYLDEWMEQIETCEFTRCSTDLAVTSMDGPVKNANVIFAGCHLGKTGDDGRLKAGVPCGLGLLEVYMDERHEVHKEYVSDEGLASKDIYIFSKPLLKFNVFNMEFINESGTARLRNITRNDNRNVTVVATTPTDTVFLAADGGVLVTQNIPSGLANIGTYEMKGSRILGGFLITYVFTEGDRTLNMYIPTLEGGMEKIDTIYDLQDIMDACGAFPVTEETLDTDEMINKCGGSI